MRKALFFLASLLQASGQPINIPLQNPSFSDGFSQAATDRCGPEEYRAPGWTFTASGVLQIANNPCGIPLPPSSTTVALVGYNGGFSQTVQVPAMPVGFYTLNFYVANYSYWYAGDYTAALSLGSSLRCSMYNHPIGDFLQMSLICPLRDKPAGPLTISFSGAGLTGLVAGPVSLTFTPTN